MARVGCCSVLSFIFILLLAICFLIFQHIQSTAATKSLYSNREGRPISLHYDKQNGVGHIQAESLADALYVQGYQHAQQRLLQMDLMRRLISGRLSELVGPKAIEMDKYWRTLGPYRRIMAAINQLNPDQKMILDAYTAGVNDYALKEMKVKPLEYWILRGEFAPWHQADSVAIAKLIMYGLSYDFQFEMLRESLAGVAGWEIADAILPAREQDYVWGKDAFILSDEDLKQSGLYVDDYRTEFLNSPKTKKSEPPKPQKKAEQKVEQKEAKKTEKPAPKPVESEKKQENKPKDKKKAKKGGKKSNDGAQYAQTIDGSNCWVVHGNHTESGYPIVAGDPHLNNGVPSIWIYSSMNISNTHFGFGSAVPGVPGLYFGKTQGASWAITSMGGDITDVFEQRIEGNKYFYDGKWHPLSIIKEEIKIKGEESYILEVKETSHGPLMNDVLEIFPLTTSYVGEIHIDRPVSVQWEGNIHPLQKFEIGALYITNPEAVSTGQKLVDHIRKDYSGFTMSMCFATKNGDIGYFGSIRLPIREPIDAGSKIREGWLTKNDWKGFAPDQVMPYVINPKKGFVSCSNQRIASDHIRYRVGGNGFPMARAVTQKRILSDLIAKGEKINFKHMMDLQMNDFDSFAADALPMMLKLIAPSLAEKYPDEISVLGMWNFESPVQSIGATLYYSWENEFILSLLGDFDFEGGMKEKAGFYKAFQWEQWFMKNLREWVQGKSLTSKICGTKKSINYDNKSCINLLVKAFEGAVQGLKLKFGEDMNLWRWGNLHRQHYKHALTRSPLKPFFHKSYAAPGSRRSLNVAVYYSVAESGFDSLHSPNQRVIVQMDGKADTLNGYWSLDMGNSGVKGTPHYEDLHHGHLVGEYTRMRYPA